MFRWVIGSSLKFRYLLVAISIGLFVFGMQQLRHMPIDVFPEFAPPKVEIQTIGIGMTPSEVEEFITIPLENILAATPGVDVIRSKSVRALSQVVLIFKHGEDLIEARQRVQELLQVAIAGFPQSVGTPVMLQPLSSTSRVMKIGISSDKLNMMDLSMLAYWKIKFQLMSVPGVANIPIWGERIKMLTVQADPELMSTHDVTLDEVMETTSNALDFGLLQHTSAAQNRIAGMIDTPNQRLAIHHDYPLFEPNHLSNVPLDLTQKRPVPPPVIDDIGNVTWDTWPMMGDAVINDEVGLMMIVEKLPWANTLEVTRGIEEALEKLKPGLKDIEIDSTIFRPATFIELSINNLTTALLFGGILVIGVLMLFLYEWRVALISIIAIPMSLIMAVLVLWFMGTTINTMVLAGFIVALGSVVDDAIIDVENVVRRLRQNQQLGEVISTFKVIVEASVEVRPAIMQATLIIVLAVIPVFFMGGLSGAFFEPLAFSFLLAMIASLIVAMTITPALCFIMLRNTDLQGKESPVVPWLKKHYDKLLRSVINAPRTTVFASIIITFCGFSVVPFLGESLLPEFKERDFLMHWIPPEGTSLPETFRITQAASVELRQIPGVRNFGAHIGRAVNGDEPYGVQFTENWVSVDPAVDYDETRGAIEEAVEGYPGMRRDVQTYLKERIREVLTGSGESIVVRISGPNLDVLQNVASDVYDKIHDIPGFIDAHVSQQKMIPQLQVKVQLDKAARFGLKPGEVRRIISTITSGQEVTDIHRDGKVYDVVIWSAESVRNDPDKIGELLIDTPYGGRVRLRDIAELKIVAANGTIKREDGSRRVDVEGNVSGRDLGAVAADVAARLAEVSFPRGYYPEILGEYKERQQAQQNLMIATIIVAAAIFLVLHATFRSFKLAAMVFISLPAALVGAMLAIFLGDSIISLGALVGIITILGIAARNGILLIQHYRHIEYVEKEAFGIDLILRGASERLSPILMTTLCTALALSPLVISGSIPGHEIEHPMAVAILGGLVTSTALTLLLVPLLYLHFGKTSGKEVVDYDDLPYSTYSLQNTRES
jgi:CzcA family heavy metal efflux pump